MQKLSLAKAIRKIADHGKGDARNHCDQLSALVDAPDGFELVRWIEVPWHEDKKNRRSGEDENEEEMPLSDVLDHQGRSVRG